MNIEPFPETLPELLLRRAGRNPRDPACYHRTAPGRWRTTDWSSLHEQVRRVSAGFGKLGLLPGDRVAILARTCPEWQVAELASLKAGAVVVGVDPHASQEQVEHMLGHCSARCLVVDDERHLAKVPEGLRKSFRFLVTLHETEKAVHPKQSLWRDLLAVDPLGILPGDHQVSTDDPATLIYTSGTTGQPKAIPYSHRQLLVACRSILGAFPDIGPGTRVLCWLPMAHLFQRMMNLTGILCGAQTYFVEDPRDIMACLTEVQPSVFVGVPRFYERFYEGIQERVAKVPRWIGDRIRSAFQTGQAYRRCHRAGSEPSLGLRLRYQLLDRHILSRIRRLVGHRMSFMITGSAPTAVRILEFFDALRLPVLEAYGVSENAVPMAANTPECCRFGSVGKPLTENEIRFAEDGEILVRGPGVFRGYEGGEPGEDCFTPEGYYRTGDIGYCDADGFLFLTGRKAEIIKTSTGRRISPARIEAVYAQSPYIEQVVVIGNGRKYLTGLIVVRREALERRFAGTGVSLPDSVEKLAVMREVREVVQTEIESLGTGLASHERIRAFAILPAPLSLERGEMTPTLKLRRDRIAVTYSQLIEELYCQPTLQDVPGIGVSCTAS